MQPGDIFYLVHGTVLQELKFQKMKKRKLIFRVKFENYGNTYDMSLTFGLHEIDSVIFSSKELAQKLANKNRIKQLQDSNVRRKTEIASQVAQLRMNSKEINLLEKTLK